MCAPFPHAPSKRPTMNTMLRSFVLSAIFCFATLTVAAVDNATADSQLISFRQTFVVDRAPVVRIDVDGGDVIVEGSISDKVSVISSGAPSMLEREMTKTGNTVTFHAKLRDLQASLDTKVIHIIRIPTNATLEIYSNGTRVDIDKDIYGMATVNGTTFRPADALVTND